MTDLDLHELVLERVIDGGFLPLEAGNPDGIAELTDRDVSVLDYFEARGYAAFRVEAPGASTWATLARWGEDGIDLLAIDRNGVTAGSARFDYSPLGAAWFAAAVTL